MKTFNEKAFEKIDFDFNLSAVETAKVDSLPITFWIPGLDKEQYDLIQALTKKRFGKHLKSVIIEAIRRVKLEEKTKTDQAS